jgi:hypothetical protein
VGLKDGHFQARRLQFLPRISLDLLTQFPYGSASKLHGSGLKSVFTSLNTSEEPGGSLRWRRFLPAPSHWRLSFQRAPLIPNPLLTTDIAYCRRLSLSLPQCLGAFRSKSVLVTLDTSASHLRRFHQVFSQPERLEGAFILDSSALLFLSTIPFIVNFEIAVSRSPLNALRIESLALLASGM